MRLAADERALLLLEPIELPAVVPVARHPVAPRPDTVRLRPLRIHSRRTVERRRELRSSQHRLRRHACVVRALAPDESALDERDRDLMVETPPCADEML